MKFKNFMRQKDKTARSEILSNMKDIELFDIVSGKTRSAGSTKRQAKQELKKRGLTLKDDLRLGGRRK